MSILVSASDLAAALADPARRVVVLDVRWRLSAAGAPPTGRDDYRDGHIPGAVFVDLDSELADPFAASGGRHRRPSRDALESAARGWGLRDGDEVVVYDDLGNLSAARAWWLLRDAGVDDVRLLDGGLAAWIREGRPLETGDEEVEPGDVALTTGRMPVIDADGAAAFPEHGTLLDARAGERYRGEVEPIDPRAGHIPGALSAPATGNLDDEGFFLVPEALVERYAELGVTGLRPVAVYCGSGVTAAHDVAALTIAGYEPSLYPGSWSDWTSDPSRPVATGAEPGGTDGGGERGGTGSGDRGASEPDGPGAA